MGEADIKVEEIPYLEFPGDDLDLVEDSEERRKLRSKVKEACEKYGCFGIVCDAIPVKLREEFFKAMKTLFDQPEERKKKHTSTKPYSNYQEIGPASPLLESFGIDDVEQPHSVQDFTNRIWPDHTTPPICGALLSMSTKMGQLIFIILKLILESLGIEKYYDSQKEKATSVLRLMRYIPPPTEDSAFGMNAHSDKSILTLLLQNDVQGLDVLSKEGNWIRLNFSKSSFIFFVGDLLKALTNGSLYAPKHRVVVNAGNKDRYSCGMFMVMKEGETIQVPEELLDDDHPPRYRPFTYPEYMSFFMKNISDDALEVYAGASA